MTDNVKPNYSDYDDIENIPVAVPVPDSNPAYNPNAPGAYNVFSVLPAPSASAPPQQQAPTLESQTTATQFIAGPTLKRSPMMMRNCPHCQQESRTRIRTFPTWQSWTTAVVMFFLFWPLCWIPLVLDSCKQTDHFCTRCGNQVGTVGAYQDCCVTHRS
jgi:hypothetical protein